MLFELLLLGCAAPEPPAPSAAPPVSTPMLYPQNVSLNNKNVNDAVLASALDDHPGGIEHLSLANSSVTDAGVSLVLTSPKTATINYLVLTGNPITNEALALLADSPRLKQLTHLYVSYAGLTAPAFVALADSPHHGALRYLAASFQPVADEGAAAIARIPGLEVVRAEESSIGPAGARALLGMPTLTSLALDQNPLGAGALVDLTSLPPHLAGLSFAKTGLGAADLATLLRLAPGALRHLDLSDCPIGDEGILLLTQWPHLTQMTSLTVPRSGASQPTLAALWAAWGDRSGLTAGPRPRP